MMVPSANGPDRRIRRLRDDYERTEKEIVTGESSTTYSRVSKINADRLFNPRRIGTNLRNRFTRVKK